MQLQIRPWIGVVKGAGITTTPLHIDEFGHMSNMIVISMKNFGAGPASIKNVFAELMLVELGSGAVNVEKRIEQFKIQPFPARNLGSTTVFPDGDLNRMCSASVGTIPRDGYLVAYVVGIIQYCDSGNLQHRTIFSYGYQKKNPMPQMIDFQYSPASDVELGEWVEWQTVTN